MSTRRLRDKDKLLEPPIDLDSSLKEKETPLPAGNSYSYPNDLINLIDVIEQEDFVEDTGEILLAKLQKLNDFSEQTITKGLQFGKKLRNSLTKDHNEGLINIIRDFSTKCMERDAIIFELKNSLSNNDQSLLRAKIYTLERQKNKLRAELELGDDLRSAIKDNNREIKSLRENILKELSSSTGEVTHNKLESTLTKTTGQIIEHIKQSSLSYAQVVAQNNSPLQGVNSKPATKGPDGVILIKPKGEDFRDYSKNVNLIKEVLNSRYANARILGLSKIYGGGIRILTNKLDETKFIIEVLTDKDEELIKNFDIEIPSKKSPKFILYNIDKEIGERELLEGLLTKNITLADSNNKPTTSIYFLKFQPGIGSSIIGLFQSIPGNI